MTMLLDAKTLDAVRFAEAQTEALFQAVLVDDEVDAVTELPRQITLDHDPARLVDCFRICRQLWKEGVDRGKLLSLIYKLERDRDLGSEDRLSFKYARAKLKHLRFACALYGENHRYPLMMDWMTVAFGHLQDAFKTGQVRRVYRDALLCRLCLTSGPQALLRREHDRLKPASSRSFRDYLAVQVDSLETVLSQPAVTGAQFHATRKIASRQVSFYDTLRTIAPSSEALMMSRSLAAINGLMGAMHDELVERRVAGIQDYHRGTFPLPEEIRRRIGELVARYRASGLERLGSDRRFSAVVERGNRSFSDMASR